MQRKSHGIHPAQRAVLYELRHQTEARFSELLRKTNLTSDTFKFHLRKLADLGLLEKLPSGEYSLTASGKEYANRLDEKTGLEIAQPKASMLLLLIAQHGGETYYLAHCRQREPFRGFWGIASAPVLRGVSLGDAAASEVLKQTGIHATFSPKGLYRVIDTTDDGEVLEDKLFSLMVAHVDGLPTPHEWHGGDSVWLSRNELLAKSPLFPITERVLTMVETDERFVEEVCVYDRDQY